MNKNLQTFLEISLMKKEVIPSDKLQEHANSDRILSD